MSRTAVMVPGSASWWLISMSPLLLFDQIRVSAKDLELISSQAGLSSYHERAARILELIRRETGQTIMFGDPQLDATYGARAISNADSLSGYIITQAGQYRKSLPTLIRPSELKRALENAYGHWIRYNEQKLSILNKDEPLAHLLRTQQIPESRDSRNKVARTPVKEIPSLLETDGRLKAVFIELVRNAWLISELATEDVRIYDSLAEEFTPLVGLVERIRVFRDLPSLLQAPVNTVALWQLYNVRLKRITARRSIDVPVREAFWSAIRDRERFAVIRTRFAELGQIIDEGRLEGKVLDELRGLIQDINARIRRIESLIDWLGWGAGTLMFVELISSLSLTTRHLLEAALFNPFSVARLKEMLQNTSVALKGVRPTCAGHLVVIRDFAGQGPSIQLKTAFGDVRPNAFRFWV